MTTKTVRRGRSRTLLTPALPGPFVNNRLLPVGPDDEGVERFWITTFNRASGALGILADERGRMRRYDLGREHPSAYAAAAEDNRTLWLCGDLSRILKLDLDSGRVEVIPTGIPGGLCHAGMALDRDLGRLFVASRSGDGATVGVSLDLQTRQVTLRRDQWPSLFAYNAIAAGPGVWRLVMYFPGRLLGWNAADLTVTPSAVSIEDVPLKCLYQLLHDERWGWYLPGKGWYDPAGDKLVDDGPRPAREMMWFGKVGDHALGAEVHEGQMQIHRWDLTGAAVQELIRVPDMQLLNVALTPRGDVATMSMYGQWRVYSGSEGGLRLSRQAPATSRHSAMCLRRIDDRRLLGTTFISQRFWMADATTGQAWDCGRAAPGTGQITQTCRVGKRIYMAAYTCGDLVEFDPDQAASFPTNPRVVASHPLAQRPVAMLACGPIIWYACSRKYGLLGCVLVRYDTRSGEATWSVDPLGPRQILSLVYDRPHDALVCGSTIHSDQAVAAPAVQQGMLASLDPTSLTLRQQQVGPTLRAQAIGWLRRGVLLCLDMSDSRIEALAIDAGTLAPVDFSLPKVLCGDAGAPWPMVATPRLGRFVLHQHRRLELHDLRRQRSLVQVLARNVEANQWTVDRDCLLLVRQTRVTVLPCRW